MFANKPDAAAHWHLGPGIASMFSVWLGILTPASEGDKNREERLGTRGGRSAREGSLGNFPMVDLELTKVSLEGRSRSPNGGRRRDGRAVLAPGKWGWLLLKETAAAGSFSPSCPPAMMAHSGAKLCGTWLRSTAGGQRSSIHGCRACSPGAKAHHCQPGQLSGESQSQIQTPFGREPHSQKRSSRWVLTSDSG